MLPPSLKISTISLDTFNATLSRYPTIAPAKLKDLDTLRYVTVPAKLAAQKAKSGEASLEKEELEALVEWKLKHGTFRPQLLSLVRGNAPEQIQRLTREASSTLGGNVADVEAVVASLKCVQGLAGVGPATASLVLSVCEPGDVPFFGDELFRWVTWGEAVGGGKDAGWKRKIKYDVKEYRVLFEGVRALRERLNVKAVDAERVAWVLGKEGKDVGGEKAEEGIMEEEVEVKPKVTTEKRESVNEKEEKKGEKKGVKRKMEKTISPPEGVRKSTRRKAER